MQLSPTTSNLKLVYQATAIVAAATVFSLTGKAQAAGLTGNTVSDQLSQKLQITLEQNLGNTPGAAVGITTPSGNWFGATGVTNLETQNPVQPDDLFQIGSITKTFTSTTMLLLAEEGKVSLEDTLGQWLPDIASNIPNSNNVTIRQLLNGTSGIGDYVASLSQEELTNSSLLFKNREPEELVAYIYNQPRFTGVRCYQDFQWCYPNTGYILAGMIIEEATGSTIATEMRNRIFNPLRLDNTFFGEEEEIPGGYVSGYRDNDGDGVLDDVSDINLSRAWTAGALVSNTQDLTTFSQSLFGGNLLQTDSLEQMLTFVDTPEGYSYGLGVMRFDVPGLGVIWGHTGATPGFAANMGYFTDFDITYTDLQNGRPASNVLNPMLATVLTHNPESVPEPGLLWGFLTLGVMPLCRKQRETKKGKDYGHNLP